MSNEQSLTPTMQQYVDIKKQHPDSLLFYRLGDFFELFFEDAVIAARELDIALTTRCKQSGKDIPMCGVPVHAYELYISRLIQKGYRVVICDQIETAEEAKTRGAKGPLVRDVTRIVTSGTITEDGLLPAENNYIATISMPNKNVVAVAIADVSTGFFGIESVSTKCICEVLTKWSPVEIVVSDDMFTNMQQILDRWKSKLTILPTTRFNTINSSHLLTSVYNVRSLDIFGLKYSHELQAAGILVDYVMSTQYCKNLSLLPPKIIYTNEYLSIDAATRRNLSLTESYSEQKNSSLFATLNKTQTAAGRRLLLKWLSSPLLNISQIESRLDDIEFFTKNTALSKQISNFLKNVPDIERTMSRIAIGRMIPKDIGIIRFTLNQWHIIQSTLETIDALPSRLRVTTDLTPLLSEITTAFNEDLPTSVKDGNLIVDGFDSALDDIRNIKDNVEANLQSLQNKYIQQTGIYNLKIGKNNIWGIYIEINSSQKTKVPFDFIHKQTLTNCIRYTTNELMELEQRIDNAYTAALNREVQIFEEFALKILVKREEISVVSEILAYIDVITSSAEFSIANKYTRPKFSEEPILTIIEGRHPVIEHAIKNEGSDFVVNDCYLNNDSRKFLLVTGPNMAGKSTYLRQNALIVIIAQAGLFVPAKIAIIGVVDKIFSRIGASDDLASGRSTFMVEMIETATILTQATAQSLVILDEIGRGTATYDGLSIAWSVSEYMYEKIQCRTLFATHYHELTLLADAFNGVVPVTASIHEWEDKIIFQHKIIDGCAQKSYGIHVAQLAGLPKEVIHRATELLKLFEAEVDVQPKNQKVIRKHINNLQKTLF
ncbi:MAG: DNA mismatch repair protein MutS [Holosporales bacterium]|jgi:DNA mismatch repair protein MutS|nr:DNA mismatch repair protein MutS [Holosporales bacterium]